MNAKLEKKLLEQYRDVNKKKICIRPAAKGKEAVVALLNGESPQVIERASAKTHKDMCKKNSFTYQEIAERCGLSVTTIKARAKKAGIHKKGSQNIEVENLEQINMERKKVGCQVKVFTKDQERKIQELYNMKEYRDRKKDLKNTIAYWAKQWGVSRVLIWRKAKEMGVDERCYKKEWSKSEEQALIKIASEYPFAFISDKMIAMGFEKRSSCSIRSKIKSLGIKEDLKSLKIRTISQEATLRNTTPYYVKKNSKIIVSKNHKYVVA